MKYLTLKQVVEQDYCVGCGLCVSQSEAGRMLTTTKGIYIPDLETLSAGELKAAETFCPSAKASDAEDRLAQEAFGDEELDYLDGLGFYHATYAGYAIESDYRKQGSSAGMVNWLCSKLLAKGLVDSIIHVKENSSPDGPMYSYQESRSVEQLQEGAKSKYYPIELSQVVSKLEREPDKKVAIIGLPCFLKGLRALEKHKPLLKKKVRFHIGIVCGHLKSKNYAEFLGWQASVSPSNLKLIDFRTKIPGRPASRYGFTAVPKSGSSDTWVVKPMSEVVGGNWGHGVFKLKACEYCDDVMAETADIVFGDAWLPEFVQDSQGTNIINSRSKFLTQLLEKETENGNIKLIKLPPEKVLDSQRSGLRHRREGLSYRSAIDRANFQLFPVKRTKPESHDLDILRKQIYEYRELIRITSHQSFLLAKQHSDLNIALSMLMPIIASYAQLTKAPLKRRVLGKAKRLVKKLFPSVF